MAGAVFRAFGVLILIVGILVFAVGISAVVFGLTQASDNNDGVLGTGLGGTSSEEREQEEAITAGGIAGAIAGLFLSIVGIVLLAMGGRAGRRMEQQQQVIIQPPAPKA